MTHCDNQALTKSLKCLAGEHQLPPSYTDNALAFYPRVIDWLLAALDRHKGSTYVLGIYGAQGTGKTTFAELLSRYLKDRHDKAVANLSIDDFYYSRAERQQLAADVNPLLATRGPPGTHDVDLALATIRRLTALAPGESIRIPRFDKATDDRAPASAWPTVAGPVDLVILEGWCIGCTPSTPAALAEPLNALERNQDRDGSWRRFVNEAIGEYQPLFALLCGVVMLKAPSLAAATDWRHEQESKLRQSGRAAADRAMTPSEIDRFLQLFERVSRRTEAEMEHRADVICHLSADHLIKAVTLR